MTRLWLFTEGSIAIGYGHISRCIAIAQAFSEKVDSIKFIISGDESVQSFVHDFPIETYNWLVDFDWKQITFGDVVVVDSYRAPLSIYLELSVRTNRCLWVDDFQRIVYPSSFILNSNPLISRSAYPEIDSRFLLLGAQYHPVRMAFWNIQKKEYKEMITDILVCIGGTDIHNLSPKIINMMGEDYSSFNLTIIGKDDRSIEIKHKKNIKVLKSLSDEQMKCEMLNADLAIGAAGQITYEFAVCGLPSILIGVADNQRKNYEFWTDSGVSMPGGWYSDSDLMEKISNTIQVLLPIERRINMGNKGRTIIDGHGSIILADKVLAG